MLASRFFNLCIVVSLLMAAKVYAADVQFDVAGANGKLADRLRTASLVVETASKDAATEQDLVAAARADYARLTGVLYEAGHYGGVISIRIDRQEAADMSPVAGPKRIGRITLRIDPGPAFAFATARVAPLAPGTILPEGFAPGRPAQVGTIGAAGRAGIAGWRDLGHARAAVADQSIVADHRRSVIDADIAIAPGPRLRFGDLRVVQAGRVRPERVRAIAGLPTGQVFSPTELEDASQRLRRSGAFRSVVLEENDSIGPGNTLDINARLLDAVPRRFGFGAELSSSEGLALSGFWLHRNLLGGAERLRIEGEVSGIGGDSGGIDFRLATRFERPATLTPDTTLVLGARIEDTDDPDFRERSATIGGGLQHIFSDQLESEIGIAFLYSEIDDDLGSRTLEHMLLHSRLTFDSRDDPLDTRSGYFAQLDLTPFLGLDRGGSGARLFADARGYFAIAGGDRVIAATRLQLGSVAGASAAEVPASMLFFSGGAGTVRGQPYQSLSVDLGGGISIGGRSFLGLSGELRTRVNETWSAVAFADTGFIGQDSWGTRNGEWHSGAGLGARYHTGIGPVRVDVATPLGSDAGENIEFYIGIGQAF